MLKLPWGQLCLCLEFLHSFLCQLIVQKVKKTRTSFPQTPLPKLVIMVLRYFSSLVLKWLSVSHMEELGPILLYNTASVSLTYFDFFRLYRPLSPTTVFQLGWDLNFTEVSPKDFFYFMLQDSSPHIELQNTPTHRGVHSSLSDRKRLKLIKNE